MKYIKDKYKGQKYMNFFDDLKIITRFDNNTLIKKYEGNHEQLHNIYSDWLKYDI